MVDASDANGGRVGGDAVNGTASAYFRPTSKAEVRGLWPSKGLELPSPWRGQPCKRQSGKQKCQSHWVNHKLSNHTLH